MTPPNHTGFLPLDMMRSNAVREAAIVNLRNLSSCNNLPAPIAKRALYLLININMDRKRKKIERQGAQDKGGQENPLLPCVMGVLQGSLAWYVNHALVDDVRVKPSILE